MRHHYNIQQLQRPDLHKLFNIAMNILNVQQKLCLKIIFLKFENEPADYQAVTDLPHRKIDLV